MATAAGSALLLRCFGGRRGDVVVIKYDTRPQTL
jgi:hypothetical protein